MLWRMAWAVKSRPLWDGIVSGGWGDGDEGNGSTGRAKGDLQLRRVSWSSTHSGRAIGDFLSRRGWLIGGRELSCIS